MSLRVYLQTVGMGLLFMLAAVACSPAMETAPTSTPEVAPAEEQAVATQAPVEEAAQTPEPREEPMVEVQPTPKQGLVATDPSMVDLASGEPMLVEFFAFW